MGAPSARRVTSALPTCYHARVRPPTIAARFDAALLRALLRARPKPPPPRTVYDLVTL